ncbi:hypothetical protein [Ferruginibacter sp.]
MRKSLTILIVSLLFFSQIGYRYIYLIQQFELKEAAEQQLLAGLRDDQLEKIDATANEQYIDWEEEDKEFSLHGQMYDVAKKKTVNGSTILYCLNDKKEEQLLTNLAKTVRSSTDDNSSNKDGKHTVKADFHDFTLIAHKTIPALGFVANLYPPYTVSLHTVVKEINTPPPDVDYILQILIL